MERYLTFIESSRPAWCGEGAMPTTMPCADRFC